MSEITQPSWHEYMKQHGTEEYAAWEAAVKPYAERIAALTQERDSALALARQAVEVLNDFPSLDVEVCPICGCDATLDHARDCWIAQREAFVNSPEVKAMGGGE